MTRLRQIPSLAILKPLTFGLLLWGVLAGGAAQAGPLPVNKTGFQPHKALYDIQLVATRSGSQIINISGQMLYEWQPSCDAWLSNHRFNLYYEYADSPPMRISSDFSTFESFDGNSMDFTSQRKREGQLFEEIRGRAVLEEKTQQASYTIPKDLSFDLSKSTLFPMGHTMAVLDAIHEGKKFFTATVFDGSDEEGPVEITSFLEGPATLAEDIKSLEKVDAKLLDNKAWKVRLAFFPLISASETSDYEMSAILHENGIISDMVIEYDDFSIRQKLVAVEALQGTCGDTPAKE